jgi:outer membrane protein assembly factor BamE (lipoprotein component of BamABCDE complex)
MCSGCSVSIQHQGSMLRTFELEEIKIGQDSKDSIFERYGPPSVASVLPDKNNVTRWYYIHRIVADSPVRGKNTVQNMSLMVAFDALGKVIDRQFVFGESSIPISSKKTSEPGYKTSFLHEAFANIGRFGQSTPNTKE